ncbi:Oxygen regulatory protein NreC [Candidatus Methylomirabilis lanthanidiphila]|uniref:Oxygen regulatory protein NreC n=1 Tax=Candidatus Methylomirabilis lanthanidiphila TaxID=2211376 RepID=A0A564ZN46_9BACT|nr:LuxR C-terminal-related transcriptional regulator [Candidatus Methylomirabilis lanthanidiphila]VUZ86062.1 Oxygen regulatory protein NreC [Candidatus Methylomirabilis lanthanidiphila]
MARDAREHTGPTPMPRQTLLMQALNGLILAAARQLDPSVLQEMVRGVGAQLGRQALTGYRLTHYACGQPIGYTWAECLKEIGEQFGWTLRVAVESEGVIRVTVLECDVTESEESGLHLCEFSSGLFGGAMAEAIGDVKVCVSRCSETPPRNCAFAIYYRTSEESLALPGVVYPRISDRAVQLAPGLLDSGPGARLTSREAQVLRQIAHGLPDKEIAAALQLSVRTVENHGARIRRKLSIGNRAALVRFALQNRLIES